MALEDIKAKLEADQKPRVKAEKFDAFMKEQQVSGFVKQEFNDDFRTVGYYSSVSPNGQHCPVQVLLNDSIYAYIKILLGYKVVNTDNDVNVLKYLNRLNNRMASFKFVVTPEGSLELDLCLIEAPEAFDPKLLLIMLLNVAVPFLDKELKALPAVVGTPLDIHNPGDEAPETPEA
jgi:hypothetical protein